MLTTETVREHWTPIANRTNNNFGGRQTNGRSMGDVAAKIENVVVRLYTSWKGPNDVCISLKCYATERDIAIDMGVGVGVVHS